MNTLLKTYTMLESHGCRFIRVLANSKRPEGKWGDDSGTAWLSAAQAVERLESKAGNVGVVPRGEVFVIDLDGDHAIGWFEQECAGLPEFVTFAVRTPNGAHVYFRASEPGLIPVTVGKTNWGEGIDIRSPNANSQVIGPGSYVKADKPEKNSGTYEIAHDAPIALAPEKIEALSRKQLKMNKRSSGSTSSPQSKQSSSTAKPSLQACRNNVTRLIREIAKAPSGTRNNTFTNCASYIGSYVAHYADEFEAMNPPPLDRLLDAVRKTFTDDDSPEERAKHLETAERQYQRGLEHPDEVDGKQSSESKAPSRFLDTIREMGFTGRFNLAWSRGEFWFPDERKGIWRSLSDHEELVLLARIMEETNWNIPQNLVKRYFAFVYEQNRINPDIELLSTARILPNRPDLTLENSLSPWLPEPDEYERWCQSAIWIQIVSKIMQSSKAIKTSVILRGETNVGKSTIVRNLVPAELGGVGNLSLLGELRNILVLLNNQYAVEYDEGLGANKKDAAFQKSIFGAEKKYIRRLHTSEAQQLDYRAAVIGTVNDEPILYDDPALINRFAFIDVSRNDDCDPAEYIPKYREHFLALALREYQEGRRAHVLPDHLVARQIEKAALSVHRDISLDDQFAVIRWWRIPLEFTIVEFAGYMGLAIDFKQYQRKRLHVFLQKYLRSKGFTGERGYEGRTWWRRPEGSSDSYPLPGKDIKKSKKREREQLVRMEYDYMNSNMFQHGNTGDLDSLDSLH